MVIWVVHWTSLLGPTRYRALVHVQNTFDRNTQLYVSLLLEARQDGRTLVRVGIESCALDTLPLLFGECELFHGRHWVARLLEGVLCEPLTLKYGRVDGRKRDVVVWTIYIKKLR